LLYSLRQFSTLAMWAALIGVVPAFAAEKRAYPLQPGDWLEVDRKRFQALSTQLDGPQLINAMPAVITFAEASRHNTQGLNDAEFTRVEQRNAYYNLISLVLEHDRITPAPLRGVRFFHAATVVTLWTQVGAIDAVDDTFCIRMSPDTRAFLREINARLFTANMRVINNLLFAWKEPRDPAAANPAVAISSWDFDQRMVKKEQGLVETVINALSPSPTVRAEIARLDNCVLSYIGSVAMRGGTDQWVRDAIGAPDFFNIKHRRAIGYSLITAFHKKTKADFLQLVQND
jgi:hypothetical protein